MARRILHRLLTCNWCQDSILLPLEKLAQAFASQEVRTTDREPIAAVCNRCKQVRNYDLANSDLSHTWGPAAYLDTFSGWIFLKSLKCTDTTCKDRLPLFAKWDPAISGSTNSIREYLGMGRPEMPTRASHRKARGTFFSTLGELIM